MDNTTIINTAIYIGFAAGGCLLGFFCRQLLRQQSKLEEVQADLNKLRLHVAEQYIHKDDFKAAIRELKESINGVCVTVPDILPLALERVATVGQS